MKTRIIHTKIWTDEFFTSLTPVDSYLFLYFLTNDAVNILHLYECPDRKILFETRVTPEELAVTKHKLQDADKVHFYKGWVYLKNADRFEDYTGPLSDKGKQTLLKQLSDEVYNWYSNLVGSPLQGALRGTKAISNKQEVINNKQEIISNKTEAPSDEAWAKFKKSATEKLKGMN